jgi:hypothetical protein
VSSSAAQTELIDIELEKYIQKCLKIEDFIQLKFSSFQFPSNASTNLNGVITIGALAHVKICNMNLKLMRKCNW